MKRQDNPPAYEDTATITDVIAWLLRGYPPGYGVYASFPPERADVMEPNFPWYNPSAPGYSIEERADLRGPILSLECVPPEPGKGFYWVQVGDETRYHWTEAELLGSGVGYPIGETWYPDSTHGGIFGGYYAWPPVPHEINGEIFYIYNFSGGGWRTSPALKIDLVWFHVWEKVPVVGLAIPIIVVVFLFFCLFLGKSFEEIMTNTS